VLGLRSKRGKLLLEISSRIEWPAEKTLLVTPASIHASALRQSYYQVTEEILKILSDLDDPDKRKVLFAPYPQLQRLDRT
jgi:hypothetical protein